VHEDVRSSEVVRCPEELGQNLFVVLDLELALLYLLLCSLYVLLLAGQAALQRTELLVELILGDESFL
jgi:hypothetical protein